MKSPTIPFVVAAIALGISLLIFTGCQAGGPIERMLPATQGELADIEAAQADAIDAQNMALEGVQEGNTTKTLFGSIFGAISALSASIGLSRRRRAAVLLKAKAQKLSDAAVS